MHTKTHKTLKLFSVSIYLARSGMGSSASAVGLEGEEKILG